MPRGDLSIGSFHASVPQADRIGRQSAWEVRIQDGRASMTDLKSLVRTADRSDTYRANLGKYQFRAVTRDGEQYLQLRKQGVWSRFKGYFKGAFAADATRRREERAGAAKLVFAAFEREGQHLTNAGIGKKIQGFGQRLAERDPELQLGARDARRLAGATYQALYERTDDVDYLNDILRARSDSEAPAPLHERDGMVEEDAPRVEQNPDPGPRLTQHIVDDDVKSEKEFDQFARFLNQQPADYDSKPAGAHAEPVRKNSLYNEDAGRPQSAQNLDDDDNLFLQQQKLLEQRSEASSSFASSKRDESVVAKDQFRDFIMAQILKGPSD